MTRRGPGNLELVTGFQYVPGAKPATVSDEPFDDYPFVARGNLDRSVQAAHGTRFGVAALAAERDPSYCDFTSSEFRSRITPR
jgi:hypothetical protein